MRATLLRIDPDALRHNFTLARAAAPGCRVLAAIKADGYGHGLVRVAEALEGLADAFGVACIEEALELRRAGIDTPLVLLEGFFSADELPLLSEYRLQALLHQPWQIEALSSAEAPLDIWLKLDSGMHRLGFPAEEAEMRYRQVEALPAARFHGFMTHLACADDRSDSTTEQQVGVFLRAVEGLPGKRGIANSAGVLGWPDSHADWIRPGIMLYGVSPFIGGVGADHDLRPAMTLCSELIAVKRLKKGDAVGYGATWTCPEDMPVGVVAIGYGDGYPRHAPNGTPVLLNGREVPLIGRVSMDMLSVDLRSQPHARVGDPVVLWGEGLPVERIAEAAGTIAYELLCGVTRRVRDEGATR